MSQARVAAVLALSATFALHGASRAAAETFTIKLTNGSSFESRYQPKAAAWDPTMIFFVNENGTEMALPKSMVTEVSSDLENRGFGRVINTSTIDLGFLANDLPEDTAATQGNQPLAQNTPNYDIQQFVEPGATGGGVPVGSLGFSTSPAQYAPPPAAAAPAPAPAPPEAANPQ
jgi:hypothetical protein